MNQHRDTRVGRSRSRLCVLLVVIACAAGGAGVAGGMGGCKSSQPMFYDPEPPVSFDAEAFGDFLWRVVYAFAQMGSQG